MKTFICETDRKTCDVRYQARGVTYYCRLDPGHRAGDHDCPADRDDRARLTRPGGEG